MSLGAQALMKRAARALGKIRSDEHFNRPPTDCAAQ
jgi:hypothetical protein